MLRRRLQMAGNGGNWEPCTYITNDNGGYITFDLHSYFSIEIEVENFENIIGENIMGGNNANVHISENNKVALRGNEINVLLQDITKIKWGHWSGVSAKNTNCIVNNTGTSAIASTNTIVNFTADLYKVHGTAGTSNFKIKKLTLENSGEKNIYLPYRCINAYDNYILNEGAFICVDNGEIIASSTLNKLVANG